MNAARRMRQYQQQAIFSASPEQLLIKIYDIGIAACHRGDRKKVRAVLQELIGSLNYEVEGDLAERLFSVYNFCMNESVAGDLELIAQFMTELRDTWRQSFNQKQAA